MRPKTVTILLSFCIILPLLVLGGLWVLLPRFLPTSSELEEIAAPILEKKYGAALKVGSVRWEYFPAPRVVIADSAVVAKSFIVRIPEVILHPDWPGLLERKKAVRLIELVRPVFSGEVAPFLYAPGAASSAQLPDKVSLLVTNGEFTIDTPYVIGGIARSTTFSLSRFNAAIDVSGTQIGMRFESVPSFADNLHVAGTVDQSTGRYSFDFGFSGLTLQGGIKSFAGGAIVPTESLANINGHVDGVGLDRQTISIEGDLPCFIIEPENRQYVLTCGYADLSVEIDKNRLALVINELELKDPGITLEGTATMIMDEGIDGPLWNIDLQGHDIDLTALRQAVLTLWGDHRVATTVASIVQGGKAYTASYRFSGRKADFADIRSMTIAADVEEARIFVPAVNLDLSGAKGPIRIVDGRLHGENLSARLGNSQGSNCMLLVGLTRQDRAFSLDIDLEADLAELPGVLSGIIHDKLFLGELARIRNTRGTAKGKLTIGNALDDFSVQVKVYSMDGEGVYDRLRHPVKVTGGELSIFPKKVEWKDIAGMIGPHALSGVSGSINWKDQASVDFSVSAEKAKIDAQPLLEELVFHPQLEGPITKVVTSLTGMLDLSAIKVSGDIREPKTWSYSLDASAGKGFAFLSPLIGVPAVANRATARISDSSIAGLSAELFVFDNMLALDGDLYHEYFRQWHGNLTLNGIVAASFASWIEEHGWIPQFWFPRIPCRAENLQVNWGGGSVSLAGNMYSHEIGPDGSSPFATLDLAANKGTLDVFYGVFTSGTNTGSFFYNRHDDGNGGFAAEWEGAITGSTVSALLRRQNFLEGSVSGTFRLGYNPGMTKPISTFGLIAADGFFLQTREGEPLSIDSVALSGEGERLLVHSFDFAAVPGEHIGLSGDVSLEGQEMKINLATKSNTLSNAGLNRILKLARRKGMGEEKKSVLDRVTGKLRFNIERFQLSTKKPSGEARDPLVWTPFEGSILLHPHGRMVAQIDHASLCSLETTGIWESSPERNHAALQIRSEYPGKSTALFQEVMPCLGIKQDLIVGELNLKADLEGTPSFWKSGRIQIESSKGQILRMGLLARIFKIVNVTDLFTSSELPDLDSRGFPYSHLVVDAPIKDNVLLLDKCIIRGEGLNIFGRGTLDLAPRTADLTILISPFKTIDAIISKVPFIGRVIGGKNATLVTIPIGVTGPIENPSITFLPPDAIGEGILNMVKDALLLPFRILSPIIPGSE